MIIIISVFERVFLNSNKRENEREVLASLADVYCYTDTVIGRKKERKKTDEVKWGA